MNHFIKAFEKLEKKACDRPYDVERRKEIDLSHFGYWALERLERRKCDNIFANEFSA